MHIAVISYGMGGRKEHLDPFKKILEDNGIRCIVPSFTGHDGQVIRGSMNDITFATYVTDLKRQTPTLKQNEKLIYVGHSRGGIVSMRASNEHESARTIAIDPPKLGKLSDEANAVLALPFYQRRIARGEPFQLHGAHSHRLFHNDDDQYLELSHDVSQQPESLAVLASMASEIEDKPTRPKDVLVVSALHSRTNDKQGHASWCDLHGCAYDKQPGSHCGIMQDPQFAQYVADKIKNGW